MKIQHIIEIARPKHWIKNLIVLFPIFFSMNFDKGEAWFKVIIAFISFSLASSATYIFNDIRDRDRDRFHPFKKHRPISSGQVNLLTASIEGIILFLSSFLVAQFANYGVLLLLALYFAIQVSYSMAFKNKMILDVICIALGFVIRAMAGAASIRVEISPWLIICTFTISLFMGFCKRGNEIATIDNKAQAEGHRVTLPGYTAELLTHFITLSGGVAVVSFLLYSSSPMTVERFGTIYLSYTLPFVIYGIFRFAMLSMRGTYADPTDLIFRDRPFQTTVLLWGISAFVIIYWGHSVQTWFENG
jgi:decaprenyl-phosphate phosphoribosyltransferase